MHIQHNISLQYPRGFMLRAFCKEDVSFTSGDTSHKYLPRQAAFESPPQQEQ